MSSTGYENYTENNYGKKPRITNEEYRERLTSWQVPAIIEHFGDLTGKIFIDVGAGDIVLGEKMAELGRPKTFYVQDLSQPSLEAGLARIKAAGFDISNITTLVSDNFNFENVPDESIDFAFSNSLFSHLSIDSILLCLRNLSSKMKKGSKYMSSMIVVPNEEESKSYDWSFLGKEGTNVISYPVKDPFHYAESTVSLLSSFRTGFTVEAIHDYGHPFQKLVEFKKK
ncbi:MAG: class I SAM-dependent methyltransferase [Sneathiella sp.]|nr:class I SAM-dependent methyltransferase [Sneathiella sp.]